jgi:hypothetical protein
VAFATAVVVVRASLDLRSGGLAFLSGSIGVAGLALLAGALLFGVPRLIGPALALLCALYIERLVATGQSDPGILAISSVGILLVGELAQWSVDSRVSGRYEPGLHVSRGLGHVWLSALGGASVALGLLAATAPVAGGLGAPVVAMAAAVAASAVISVAARRAGQHGREA